MRVDVKALQHKLTDTEERLKGELHSSDVNPLTYGTGAQDRTIPLLKMLTSVTSFWCFFSSRMSKDFENVRSRKQN